MADGGTERHDGNWSWHRAGPPGTNSGHDEHHTRDSVDPHHHGHRGLCHRRHPTRRLETGGEFGPKPEAYYVTLVKKTYWILLLWKKKYENVSNINCSTTLNGVGWGWGWGVGVGKTHHPVAFSLGGGGMASAPFFYATAVGL